MKNQLQQLQQLSAGSEFSEYLIANGWKITEINTLNDTQVVFFERTYFKTLLGIHRQTTHRLSYHCNYYGSKFVHESTLPNERHFNIVSEHTGIINEDSLSQFACLCHAMGWVTFQEANLNCKSETGQSLSSFISDLVAGPKKIANDIFKHAHQLCEIEK